MQQGESLFVLKGNPKNEIASFRAFRVANPCNLKLDLILAEKATLHQPLKRCSQATRSCGQRLSHCPREVIARGPNDDHGRMWPSNSAWLFQ